MCGVVYLILNLINGKRYVGQTTQPLKVRFNEHARKKDNTPISNAIRKYGRENFYCGVIKTCASKAELNYWEKYFIAVLKSKKPYGYNLTDGGEGTVGYHLTPEACAKISAKNSIALLGNKNSLGYHHTPESRAKMSADRKDKPKTAEHRAKIAAANTGKKFTPERCANISASKKGKPLSLEHRAKIAATSRGNCPFKNLLSEIEARQLYVQGVEQINRNAAFVPFIQNARRTKIHGKRQSKTRKIFWQAGGLSAGAQFLTDDFTVGTSRRRLLHARRRRNFGILIDCGRRAA